MSDSQNQPGSTVADYFQNPLAQAVLTGALTLIPARDYPTWLRRTLVWGPVVAAPLGGALLAANPHLVPALRAADQPGQQAATPEERARRAAKGLVAGAAFGGVMSGLLVAGLWADEQLERGLRRLRVPYPRVVMAGAAGVLGWVTSQPEAQHDPQP